MPEFAALQSTGLEALLSDVGKDMFLPKGIFYWSGRAKKEAKINGTFGVAMDVRKLIYGEGGSGAIGGVRILVQGLKIGLT